jgi:TolB-like protein/Flp pilus assembly protein TadD/tRNA A-37 threonylcarbamoyl transferase component Bud32
LPLIYDESLAQLKLSEQLKIIVRIFRSLVVTIQPHAMSSDRWRDIQEIFQMALDLGTDERASYLDECCAGDEELRQKLQALLSQHEEAGGLLNETRYEESGLEELGHRLESDDDPLIGQRIGAYRIEREIGRGGMGAVYLAERADNAFQRRVAIKVIKRGMDTDFVLRRFRHERRILAALDHPFITRLLDGGATRTGQPYFVMEFIEGRPLYAYCDSHRINLRERLRLFCQVCEAVDYAHRKQVVHRDIKPSNILVTDSGLPKLFDFGIAKLLDPDLASDTSPQTATAMRMMTVEYASPEQVQGLPVTFLSDVYSLGVVLYELLTGYRPYIFRSRMLHEMARVISEEEPERPSLAVTRSNYLLTVAHVSHEAVTIGHLCELRGETPESLSRELSGSLDRITLKALRKNPAERYASAAELRDDVMRYLEGQPVIAPLYFPQAGPTRITSGVAKDELSIAVLPFKLMTAPQRGDSGDEFLGVGLADALITRLSNVRRLVVRPTSSILPYVAREADALTAGDELGVGFVLDGYVQRAGDRLRVSVQLLNVNERTTVWAEAFHENFTDVFGIQDAISTQVAQALVPRLSGFERKQLAKHGTDNPEAFEAYLRGRYYLNLVTPDGFRKALAHFERAVALDPTYALAYSALADCYFYMGAFSTAPPSECAETSRRMAERAIALDDTLGEAYTILGYNTYYHDFDPAEAERLLRYGLQLNPNHAAGHMWYSVPLVARGDFDQAVTEAGRAAELDPASPFNQQHLSWILYQARRFDEALEETRKVVESAPDFNHVHGTYGWMLRHAGRYEEAIEQGRRAVELSGETPWLAASLAATYARAGRTNEARDILQQLEEVSANRYVSPYNLAFVHLYLGERERALQLLEEALQTRDGWLVWMPVEPQLDPLRDDPRFTALLQRMKVPQAPNTRAALETETDEGEAAGAKAIAILPFKMIGAPQTGETGDEYLEVGLADALITRLSNVRRLIVRPTSSVLQYGKVDDPLEAGRRLDVEYVVAGNIRRAGEKLRITVQLLSVSEEAAVWAGKFDEELTDVLLAEDMISEQVAIALIPKLTGEEQHRLSKRGTNKPEAFDAYLRGRYYWNTPDEESIAKSLFYYQRAVSLDPDYALAHAGIADYYNMLGVYGVMPFAEAASKAKDAALKSVALDDTLAAGYAALGFATLMRDFDWRAAEEHLRRAVSLYPNYSTGRLWYGYFYALSGQPEEALAHARRALELDPFTPLIRQTANWIYYLLRRYEEAIEAARRVAANDPQYGISHVFLCLVLSEMGQHEEAIEAGHKAVELLGRSPYTLTRLASAYAASGRHEAALTLLEEIKRMSETRYVSPSLLATIYLHLKDYEGAFAELERAMEIRDARLIWLGVDPQFDVLRSDARFNELLRQTNNPAPQPRLDRPSMGEPFGSRKLSSERVASDPQTGQKSVAVLPFQLMGAPQAGDTSEEYLGVGLADALITRLSNVRRLIVRPTSSVLQYGTEGDPFEAGRRLAVDYIVDGNIRRAGETLRVTVQLLSVQEEAARWAGKFDEKLTDVLLLEDLISEQVATALIPRLTGEEQQQLAKRGTNNAQAYEAYLRGRHHFHSLTEEGFAKSLQDYYRAISFDPDYALAYAGIADYHIFQGIYGIMPFAESSAAAKEAAQRAVELDDALAEAHAALAFAIVCFDFDWRTAEQLHQRAIELNPNSTTAHNWYAFLLMQEGRFDEAFDEVRRALSLDPVSPLISLSLCWCYYHSRRLDEALEAYRKVIESEPRFGYGRVVYSWALRCAGRHVEAVAQAEKAVELAGDGQLYLSGLAAAYAGAERLTEAREVINRLDEMSRTRYVSPYCLALIYCYLDDKEKALALLEEAITIGDAWVAWLAVDPQLDSLRSDPRFNELVRRTKNPAVFLY